MVLKTRTGYTRSNSLYGLRENQASLLTLQNIFVLTKEKGTIIMGFDKSNFSLCAKKLSRPLLQKFSQVGETIFSFKL